MHLKEKKNHSIAERKSCTQLLVRFTCAMLRTETQQHFLDVNRMHRYVMPTLFFLPRGITIAVHRREVPAAAVVAPRKVGRG